MDHKGCEDHINESTEVLKERPIKELNENISREIFQNQEEELSRDPVDDSERIK